MMTLPVELNTCAASCCNTVVSGKWALEPYTSVFIAYMYQRLR